MIVIVDIAAVGCIDTCTIKPPVTLTNNAGNAVPVPINCTCKTIDARWMANTDTGSTGVKLTKCLAAPTPSGDSDRATGGGSINKR